MKIQEAKDNIMKNFRANYTNDHFAIHDVEIFLLNTLENFELVVAAEARKHFDKTRMDFAKKIRLDAIDECLDVIPKDRIFKHKECKDGQAECCDNCITKGFINEWLRATRDAIFNLK